VLGRIIEAVTNMTYAEAVRKWLLDPAGVDPQEMYLGSTRIDDIPPDEAEYYFTGNYSSVCPGPSLFPEDEGKNLTCPYGSFMVMESSDSLGAWVTSARQLVKIIAAISPPHCPEDECLLSKESREEMEEMASFYPSNSSEWYGLGWLIHKVNGGLTWHHTGGLPGTVAIFVRMDEEDGYAYAIIFNGDFNNETTLQEASPDIVISGLAKCVNDDEWPVDYYKSELSSGASMTVVSASRFFVVVALVMATLFLL
jgi:CubicO group peptidase (beta-lactamase class C family)